MPLPVIANVIRCAVVGTLSSGRQWVNVHHFEYPVGEAPAATITAVDALLVHLYSVSYGGSANAPLAYMTNNSGITDINYLRLDGSSGGVTVPHILDGASGVDSLPANTSLVVTHQTGLRGRDKRGRTFLPPLTEGANDATGGVLGAVVVGLQAQFTAFLAAATAAVEFPVVASYVHRDKALIVDYVVRNKWATRRKRQGRQP